LSTDPVGDTLRSMRFVYALGIACGCSSASQSSSNTPASAAVLNAAPDAPSAYRCFSYVTRSKKGIDCYRGDDCVAEAKKLSATSVEYQQKFGGPPLVLDVSDCSPAPDVWCFHERGKHGDKDSCSPSAEACAASRAETHDDVESDCAHRQR
jgi:hypothetical protein